MSMGKGLVSGQMIDVITLAVLSSLPSPTLSVLGTSMAKNAISKSEENRTCCSVIENAKNESRARRSKRTGPQSWFALKITIALALGIMGYTSYVYYDRICKPMLRRVPNALGSRGLGIAFLVVFSILFLMMLWTYVKVIVTPPGFAKNHVKKSKKPTHILPDQTRDSLTSDDVGGTSYENMLVSAEAAYLPPRANEESHPGHSHSTLRVDGGDTITPHRDGSRSSRSVDYERPVPSRPSPEIAGVLDAIQGPIRASRKAAAALPPQSNDDTRPGDLSRRPRMTPNLLPAYRYCSKDEHIKPLRAHHCRSCGTCVLKYDHHCPWIGQCVGARNQKFFVNFLQWSTVFCAWTFATLVALIPRVSKNDRSDIDAQHIVVIALSGLFLIFTGTLLMNHVTLILLNQTTVESIGHQDMKEQESAALGRVFGWYQCRAKRRKRREWDAEWGKIGLEGNLWWLGSLRANWEATMGVNPSWWILPIGRSASDGLNYPTNPRFDGEGRWRRRQDWPEGL